MKKITALLLCFLLLCAYGLTAFAEAPEERSSSVLITVTVPDTHEIIVQAESAKVFYQGISGDMFTVERLSTPRILIRPEGGKVILSVLRNGEDVTSQVHGGYLELPPVYEDQTIIVITGDEPAMPQDTFTVRGKVTLNGQPLPDVVLELRSTLKATKTDEKGGFVFRNVELGTHSLTALKDGIVVGYMFFDLKKGDRADVLLLEDGSYTVSVDQSGIGVELHLVLNEELGTLIPEEISSIGRTDPNVPETGDGAHLMFWLILFFASGACIAVSELQRRKKM